MDPFTFPYVIVNAFTTTAFGGNPAVIILLPPGSFSADNSLLDGPTMTLIARALGQPITVFLSPPAYTESFDNDRGPIYDIRFVVDTIFPPVCGHGTLATTKAICRGMLPGVAHDVARNPAVEFRISDGSIISTRALGSGDKDIALGEEFYEIVLPLHAMKELPEAEKDGVRKMVAKALRKDVNRVGFKYLGEGIGDAANRLMVVLDPSEPLEGRDIDINAFVSRFFGGILRDKY